MGAYKYSVRTGTKATSERSALQALEQDAHARCSGWCLIEFPAQKPPCLRPRVHGTCRYFWTIGKANAFYFDENHRVFGYLGENAVCISRELIKSMRCSRRAI